MKKISLAVITLFSISCLTAQTAIDSLPGNPSLPSSEHQLAELAALEKGNYAYSVNDYFQKPNQSSFEFSPNGLYLSYKEKDENNKNHVYVKNTETNEVIRIIKEDKNLVRAYGWANNSRIVYIKDKGGDENYHLFAVDIDGENQKELTPYDKVKVTILN